MVEDERGRADDGATTRARRPGRVEDPRSRRSGRPARSRTGTSRTRRGRRRDTVDVACRRPGPRAATTAVQRCSRAGEAERQRPSAAMRYGQTAATSGATGVGVATWGALMSTMRFEDTGSAADPTSGWFPQETQKSRRRPIFPKGCPLSIFGAGELDCRVRDGNGYGLSARVTGIRRVWMVRQRHSSGPCDPAGAGRDLRSRGESSRIGSRSQPLTPGQLLKRSSPRPLVPLSFIRHRTSTCGLSNRWSPCGLTRLTRWGTSSRGELRT